ncbi:suppressor of tub2 mutation [Hypoxylon texense]
MGRKPNPLILEYFERGAKLNDNSNRYHHRCKLCGEDFPKGRIDSLTTHLTKKCSAISEQDRIQACLALHGLPNGADRTRFDGLLHTGPNAGPQPSSGLVQGQNLNQGQNQIPNQIQGQNQNQNQSQNQIWTPLETLAEVSRQIEANEKQDDHVPTSQDLAAEAVRTTLAAAVPTTATASTNPFELHEQFTIENPPMSFNNHSHNNKGMPFTQYWGPDMYQPFPYMGFADVDVSTEDRLQQLLQNVGSPSQSALSVAAAATARLNPSLLDPQFNQRLVPDEAIPELAPQPQPHPQPQPQLPPLPQLPQQHQFQLESQSADMMIAYSPSPESQPTPASAPVTPWEGMTYMAEGIHAPATVNDHGQHLGMMLNKGGHRMDTSNVLGTRHRHSRARFDSSRRKQVQEVRRIGACIRCRILRKTCSKGEPCATCAKVLHPRVWVAGCVRTKLCDYINLYSAKVQAVMSQKRINNYKSTYELENTGIVVEVSHFPETGYKAILQVIQGTPKEGDSNPADSNGSSRILLLDYGNEDISSKVETYMRQTLHELISREPSHYVRVTLEIATMVAEETNDELLKRSLELWGIVEMMDRERQWTMLAKSPKEGVEDYWIKDDSDSEAYTNICMQLTAAAERKADTASQSLLKGIQHNLQDAKIKLGFAMFLTVMLFLNCMEKTTWAFKAWDEENLRPKWPLQKPPSDYTQQGEKLTELLRMLLAIRHVLPKTAIADDDSPLRAEDDDPMVQRYFQHLNVTRSYLQTRVEHSNFQPTDSRSLEFLFCAPLLLNNNSDN